MAILYVTEQGVYLVKKEERIEVRKDEQRLQSIPVDALDQIVLFGNVGLSAPLRNYLLDQNVDTVFLTRSGRFRGRLTSYSGANIELRREQFRRIDDPEFALQTSRRFVKGKIGNCRVLLQRHQRRNQNVDISRGLLRLRGIVQKLDSAQNVEQLRGFEGEAGAVYFPCLSEVINVPEFRFRRRSRRPPLDPFNSVISFGYTMLLSSVMTAVQTVGLEPYLGFLHTSANGKPAVGLDLMEEFRALLVDSLAVRMVNRKQLDVSDFTIQSGASFSEEVDENRVLTKADYPVLMGRLSIRKWLALYNEQLDKKLEYPRYGKRLKVKQIILEQARLLARHIRGQEEYEAFVIR